MFLTTETKNFGRVLILSGVLKTYNKTNSFMNFVKENNLEFDATKVKHRIVGLLYDIAKLLTSDLEFDKGLSKLDMLRTLSEDQKIELLTFITNLVIDESDPQTIFKFEFKVNDAIHTAFANVASVFNTYTSLIADKVTNSYFEEYERAEDGLFLRHNAPDILHGNNFVVVDGFIWYSTSDTNYYAPTSTFRVWKSIYTMDSLMRDIKYSLKRLQDDSSVLRDIDEHFVHYFCLRSTESTSRDIERVKSRNRFEIPAKKTFSECTIFNNEGQIINTDAVNRLMLSIFEEARNNPQNKYVLCTTRDFNSSTMHYFQSLIAHKVGYQFPENIIMGIPSLYSIFHNINAADVSTIINIIHGSPEGYGGESLTARTAFQQIKNKIPG